MFFFQSLYLQKNSWCCKITECSQYGTDIPKLGTPRMSYLLIVSRLSCYPRVRKKEPNLTKNGLKIVMGHGSIGLLQACSFLFSVTFLFMESLYLVIHLISPFERLTYNKMSDWAKLERERSLKCEDYPSTHIYKPNMYPPFFFQSTKEQLGGGGEVFILTRHEFTRRNWNARHMHAVI